MAIECNICKINTSKYKCSRCNIPYCSASCYKAHKESQLQVECTSNIHREYEPISSIQDSDIEQPNPPPTLDGLQQLFKKYPGLCKELRLIYEATIVDTQISESRPQGDPREPGITAARDQSLHKHAMTPNALRLIREARENGSIGFREVFEMAINSPGYREHP